MPIDGSPSGGSSSGTSTDGGAAGTTSAGAEGGSATVLIEPDVIDDMEDNDAQITPWPGRNGFWYVGHDGTVGGVQEPPEGVF